MFLINSAVISALVTQSVGGFRAPPSSANHSGCEAKFVSGTQVCIVWPPMSKRSPRFFNSGTTRSRRSYQAVGSPWAFGHGWIQFIRFLAIQSADGDRLRDAQQRKIEHHPILKRRPGIHLQRRDLQRVVFGNRIITRNTPAAAQSFQEIVHTEQHRPRARALDLQLLSRQCSDDSGPPPGDLPAPACPAGAAG